MSARAPLAGARRAFLLDLLIAVLVMVVLSLAGGVVWALFEAVQAGVRASDGIQAAELAARIGTPGPLALLALAATSTGGAALLLYAWRRRADPGERARSRQAAGRAMTWAWAAVAGSACFLWSTGLTRLAEHWGASPDPSNAALVEAAMHASPWALLVFAVVLAPMYEELLFRRVLFGRLLQAGRPLLGLVLSSAAFALLHEIPGLGTNPLPVTALLWLVYGGMGAVFALLYWRCGTLWAPIGAHALNNALALAVMMMS